jgi:hypothetical protein
LQNKAAVLANTITSSSLRFQLTVMFPLAYKRMGVVTNTYRILIDKFEGRARERSWKK